MAPKPKNLAPFSKLTAQPYSTTGGALTWAGGGEGICPGAARLEEPKFSTCMPKILGELKGKSLVLNACSERMAL